jgi:DNA-binding CsgD family transcriptional regulator
MRVTLESSLMRGREAEWDLVVKLLDSTRRGKSGVLLLDGEPGIGKSMLLGAANDAASAHGFVLAASAAEGLNRFAPLAPLPASDPGLGTAERRAAAGAVPTGNARAHLEELASAGPVLVGIDDLHWADPSTLHKLRTLPGLLAPYPLSWILARSTQGGSREAALLFEALEHGGAARTRLRPLVDEAQVAMMTDVLGAVPDAGLVERAACADGNPFMLAEFLRGLLDERAIKIAEGRASLLSRKVPRRFESIMRSRLNRLAPRTRQLLETGAILGRSFRLEDAAEMLRESPGSLLAPVEEALAARVVVATPDAIAFHHDLVWRVVTDALPPPVRQALHRQAGEMLLARGGSAVPAAEHLLAGARAGDPVVLAGLDRAAAETIRSSPQAAAEIAVQALDLTTPAGPERLARTVTAVRALTAAGRWEQASPLVQSALAVPMEVQTNAPLRCALAALHAMTGRPGEALTEAEGIMADLGLAPEVRDDAKVVLFQALTGLHDNQRAAQAAAAILAQPDTRRGEVVVAALLVLALVAWDSGRVTESLELAADAVRNENSQRSPARRFHPDLFLASKLIDIRRFTDAEAIMGSAGRADTPAPISWSVTSPDILRARMALAAGRLDEAAAEASCALAHTGAVGMRLHSSLARSILAVVALRQGDLHAAARQIENSPAPAYHFVSAYEATWNGLVAAQVEEARNGPGAAMSRLDGLYGEIGEHRYLLMSDPDSAPWLVRTALAAGDDERAKMISGVMTGIIQNNPAVPVFRACADHARGVLESDRAALAQAVTGHEDPWTRASAAEDLAVLLAADSSTGDAVGCLDTALEGYGGIGSERDAARIRRRLRRRGVRRRHWASAKRPPTGWDSLTDTERSTSELVARGLTNQQVADQLFISVHTVAFHLRQVFRKLGIRSRVELARAALERSPQSGQAPETYLAPAAATRRRRRGGGSSQGRRGRRGTGPGAARRSSSGGRHASPHVPWTTPAGPGVTPVPSGLPGGSPSRVRPPRPRQWPERTRA